MYAFTVDPGRGQEAPDADAFCSAPAAPDIPVGDASRDQRGETGREHGRDGDTRDGGGDDGNDSGGRGGGGEDDDGIGRSNDTEPVAQSGAAGTDRSTTEAVLAHISSLLYLKGERRSRVDSPVGAGPRRDPFPSS